MIHFLMLVTPLSLKLNQLLLVTLDFNETLEERSTGGGGMNIFKIIEGIL